MSDLRSPLEDRPYRPSERPSTRLAQDDVDQSYGMSVIDRIRYSRWFPLGSVFAAVLIFSGIISYAYKQGAQTGVNETTPVVAADNADYKEKPANPGGMDVPFQDAVVFDQLQGEGQTTKADTIESLLPPPEQPVAATETAAAVTEAKTEKAPEAAPAAVEAPKKVAEAPKADAIPTETIKETPVNAAPVSETPAKAEAVTTEGTLAAPVAKSVEPVKEVVKKEEPVKAIPAPAPVIAAPTPAPTPAPTAAKVESGSYRIQLGAFRDEAAARSAWNSTKGKFSQLAGVTPDFPRADLGAKGIFYRAQGKNLSKASADEMCRAINASKAGSCIVTH